MWRLSSSTKPFYHGFRPLPLLPNPNSLSPIPLAAKPLENLGKVLPKYPLPVLRLARLAVDHSFKGKGLGLSLLRFVMRLALQMA